MSTEVLTTIIKTLTDGNALEVTMEDFIQQYINRYIDRYSIIIEKDEDIIAEYNPSKREDLTGWKSLV